jgi:hypothetical protein
LDLPNAPLDSISHVHKTDKYPLKV